MLVSDPASRQSSLRLDAWLSGSLMNSFELLMGSFEDEGFDSVCELRFYFEKPC